MDWYTYSQILMEKCKKKEIPYHVGFELTPLCNFDCNMCYVHLSPEEVNREGKMLTTEQWIHLAEEAKEFGALTMEITGGEAATRADFPILFKHFIKMGFLIVLRTNGYLIKGKLLEIIKQYKPRLVMVTLYGASDDTYERVCGIKDGFSVVTKNVLAIKEANIPIRLSSTITTENINDVQMMKEWAQKHNLDFSVSGHLFTPKRGSNRDIVHLQVRYPDEDYMIPEDIKPLKREIADREKYMNPFWMCRTFGAKCSITWDGKMVLCNSNSSIKKDPLITGFAEAYRGLYKEYKNIQRPEKCRNCEYIDLCTICPSMMYSSTGSMEETNDNLCKYARRTYKNRYIIGLEKIENEEQLVADRCEEGGMIKSNSR